MEQGRRSSGERVCMQQQQRSGRGGGGSRACSSSCRSFRVVRRFACQCRATHLIGCLSRTYCAGGGLQRCACTQCGGVGSALLLLLLRPRRDATRGEQSSTTEEETRGGRGEKYKRKIDNVAKRKNSKAGRCAGLDKECSGRQTTPSLLAWLIAIMIGRSIGRKSLGA